MDIHTYYLTGIFVIILIAIIKLSSVFSFGKKRYVLAQGLFTKAELSFLRSLKKAVGGDFAIYGKVRVADVINVRSGLSRRAWQHAFNFICAKHFDYVLCDRTTHNIVAVIELNDKSHDRLDRRRRDRLLSEICADIGLPMIQIVAARTYSPDVVRDVILRACHEIRTQR